MNDRARKAQLAAADIRVQSEVPHDLRVFGRYLRKGRRPADWQLRYECETVVCAPRSLGDPRLKEGDSLSSFVRCVRSLTSVRDLADGHIDVRIVMALRACAENLMSHDYPRVLASGDPLIAAIPYPALP